MKEAIIIGLMLILCVAAEATEYTLDKPDTIEPGKVFYIEHKFVGMAPGDQVQILETFSDGVAFTGWEVRGSNRSLQGFSRDVEAGEIRWNFTSQADAIILAIHLLSLGEEMEYPYYSEVTYDNQTKTQQDIFDIVQERIPPGTDLCFDTIEHCEGDRFIRTARCLDGELVETGQVCPVTTDVLKYYKIIIAVLLTIVVISVYRNRGNRKVKVNTKKDANP